ncbi:hypothetical protein KY312_00975 [Candidatus Woesearchaeota archaeon]|nr:hypothetical protein [Candidatus Woesearchaeota archaeon]
MNNALRAVLMFLLNKRYIGGKHTLEDKLVKSKIKWLGAKERSEFKKEYKKLLNEGIILRAKKRTGKGSDWHICLNPRKLQYLIEMLRID